MYKALYKLHGVVKMLALSVSIMRAVSKLENLIFSFDSSTWVNQKELSNQDKPSDKEVQSMQHLWKYKVDSKRSRKGTLLLSGF